MRVSLFAPTLNPIATPEYLEALGQAADACGIHALWAPEHVVLFDDYGSQYPYAESGRIPAGGERGMLDVFASLAFLAAVSERVRLGTGICLVPQRNPVYTAKEVATVDWLSNGRVDLGVGVGWLKEEFEALQVPFERRGSRCREYLEVIRRLWCDPISEFKGEFYKLPPCRSYPKPVQSPHPPIYFGGESDAALSRVADLGQGWYGFNLVPADVEPHVRRLEAALDARERKLSDVDITVSPYTQPGVDIEMMRGFRDAGVDQVVVMLAAGKAGHVRDAVQRVADELIAPL